jgi:hypothetical protein
MKKEDFKVNYDNGRLTISSEISEDRQNAEDERYTRREYRYQSFQRSFTVPENVVYGERSRLSIPTGSSASVYPSVTKSSRNLHGKLKFPDPGTGGIRRIQNQ